MFRQRYSRVRHGATTPGNAERKQASRDREAQKPGCDVAKRTFKRHHSVRDARRA